MDRPGVEEALVEELGSLLSRGPASASRMLTGWISNISGAFVR